MLLLLTQSGIKVTYYKYFQFIQNNIVILNKMYVYLFTYFKQSKIILDGKYSIYNKH